MVQELTAELNTVFLHSLTLLLLPRKSCGAFERLSRLKSFDYLALGELFALPSFLQYFCWVPSKERWGDFARAFGFCAMQYISKSRYLCAIAACRVAATAVVVVLMLLMSRTRKRFWAARSSSTYNILNTRFPGCPARLVVVAACAFILSSPRETLICGHEDVLPPLDAKQWANSWHMCPVSPAAFSPRALLSLSLWSGEADGKII